MDEYSLGGRFPVGSIVSVSSNGPHYEIRQVNHDGFATLVRELDVAGRYGIEYPGPWPSLHFKLIRRSFIESAADMDALYG